MPHAHSDHRAICLNIAFHNSFKRSFKFDNHWLNNSDFLILAAMNWSYCLFGNPLYIHNHKLTKLKDAIKDWKRQIPTRFNKSKYKIKNDIQSIQGLIEISLSNSPSDNLQDLKLHEIALLK